jgi:hypothetical protein
VAVGGRPIRRCTWPGPLVGVSRFVAHRAAPTGERYRSR